MKIGMIGLGAMGNPMAARLLEVYGELFVFDVSKQAVSQLTSKGATECTTVVQLASKVEVLLLSLPNGVIIKDVLQKIIGEGKHSVQIIADMSSISPSSSRDFAEMMEKEGVTYMDCPVSGGVGGAENGTLTVMVGGPESALERIMPVLQSIGKKIYHVGDTGAGSGIKMINNYMLGCNMAVAAEALVLGKKIGLDTKVMQDIILNSSGRSFIIENKLPNFIMKRKFDGGFAVDLQYKDIGLAYETAKSFNMPIPMGSTAIQVMDAARAKGYGKQDITAMVKIWEELMDAEV